MLQLSAARLGGIDELAFEEVGVPKPHDDDVVIKVEATALGFVDGLILAGRYQLKPTVPYVPGGEIAGVIEAVGDRVATYRPGDRVSTWQLGGGLAEFARAPARDVQPIPAQLSAVTAAAMLVDYQTAHYALVERGKLMAGERVLVLGAAGGVGAAAVEIAASLGGKVIAATSSAEKAHRAIALGASDVISSNCSGLEMRDQLRSKGPAGVIDVIVDPVGGEQFESMFRALAKGGRHLVIGFAAGAIPALPVNLALLKSASLVGVDVRHFVAASPDHAARNLRELFDAVVSGDLIGPAVRRYTLAQAQEAMIALSDRNRMGKVVVTPQ